MKKKKQKQKITLANPQQSDESSLSTLELREQVKQVNKKVVESISRMAQDENISFSDFVANTNKVAHAFRIMDAVIDLGEQMKKLKDGK